MMIVPTLDGETIIVILAALPGARSPRSQLITLSPEQLPMLDADDTSGAPWGSVTVTLAPVAGSGPLLAAINEYVSSFLTITGLGAPLRVIARSALAPKFGDERVGRAGGAYRGRRSRKSLDKVIPVTYAFAAVSTAMLRPWSVARASQIG